MSKYNEDLDYLIPDIDISKEEFNEIIVEADKKISNLNCKKGELIEAYIKKIQSLQKLNKYRESRKIIDKLLELSPNNPVALLRLGIIHDEEKNDNEAIDLITKAIELKSDYAIAYSNRGNIYKSKEEIDLAIADYNKAIELKPDYPAAYFHRGNIYKNKEELDLAIADYNKVIELKPNYPVTYFHRGNIYESKEELDLAIADYNKAIELKPDYPAAYFHRGNIYKSKGEPDIVKADYNKAVELDSQYYDAYYIYRSNSYNIENQSMRIIGILKNKKYMDELKEKVDVIVPFLGAGVSIPYGYYSWKTLLKELLNRCTIVREKESNNIKEKILGDINNGNYIDAANELDKIYSNLSSTLSHIIEDIAESKSIKIVNSGFLGVYLHLFPSEIFLTTNYDKVIEDILKLQKDKQTEPIIATLQNPIRMDFAVKNKDKKRKVYYLHGIYSEPNSIILSGDHYDDYYGAEDNIKSNLRRFLPKELRKLHNNRVFLYIGCSMTIEEDRILKLLRNFYAELQDCPRSYALLNVNEVTGSDVPIEDWKDLNPEQQEELNIKLKQKEAKLEDMNVSVIWYSALTNNEHELAQHELLEYILKDRRFSLEARKREQIKNEEEEKIKKNKNEKQGKIWEKAFENTPCFNCDHCITCTQCSATNNSEVQCLQIRNFLQNKILTRIDKDNTEKYEIKFPMYKVEGGLYQISLVSENGVYYLSDNGTTYTELDRIFELKEPDVIKNLVAILKQYGCNKHPNSNAFIIECALENVDIKMSYLIQAISFMLNMKIFYT